MKLFDEILDQANNTGNQDDLSLFNEKVVGCGNLDKRVIVHPD